MRATIPAILVAWAAAAGVMRADEPPNPEYKAWAQYEPGTTCTVKETKSAPIQSEVVWVYTLKEVAPDQVTLESRTISLKIDGQQMDVRKLPPRTPRTVPARLPAPPPPAGGAAPRPPHAPNEKNPNDKKASTDTIVIDGHKFECTLIDQPDRTGGGRAWMHPAIPWKYAKLQIYDRDGKVRTEEAVISFTPAK